MSSTGAAKFKTAGVVPVLPTALYQVVVCLVGRDHVRKSPSSMVA